MSADRQAHATKLLPQHKLSPGSSLRPAAPCICHLLPLLLFGGRPPENSCRSGFNEVFPLDALKCFFEDEIEAMMCGTGEKWSVEALTDTIKFDHGYTATSTAIGFFLDILTELDAADQRRFLRFVTGSPRLPPGGIAALHPRCAPANTNTCSASVQQVACFLL